MSALQDLVIEDSELQVACGFDTGDVLRPHPFIVDGSSPIASARPDYGRVFVSFFFLGIEKRQQKPGYVGF